MRTFGEDLTVHGFWSTFKDWCSDQTGYPNEMSEMALALTVSDKVEAAFRAIRLQGRAIFRAGLPQPAQLLVLPQILESSRIRMAHALSRR